MIKRFTIHSVMFLSSVSLSSFSQVDTTRLYDPAASFGPMDLRIAKSPSHFYHLEENITFSFREVAGVRTKTYLDMTAWDSAPYGEGNLREKTDSSDLFIMNYRLLQPMHYDETYPAGYPLVIVLHGFLERGNCAENKCYFDNKEFSPNKNEPPAPTSADHPLLNNDYNLVHAGLNYLNAYNLNGGKQPDDPQLPSRGFPGFVLFPQNMNGWEPSAADDVIRLIRLLSKKYNIDDDRIYINGISHGGHGAYEVLKRAPWMFAAAVMFSAADDASVISQNMVKEIAQIPLWIFQGGQDTNPSKAETDRYVESFRRAGATVRYTIYPHLGHGTWNEALDEPDFFNWLLSQERTKIHLRGGSTAICSTSGQGLLLSLPKGFKSYEWEHNGTVIKRGSANTYVASEPGTYRARFSAFDNGAQDEWGEWSQPVNLDIKTPDIPEVRPVGTLWLPDLNGNSDARLQATGRFPHYYWYKDGKLLKSFGDTLQSITLTPALGNGVYTVRVSGYDRCISADSEGHQIIFQARSSDLPPPYDLTGLPVSPSAVTLRWSNSSGQQARFEIWRRAEAAAGNYSLWEMDGITEPGATSFTDYGLLPSTVYHYKVRAVTTSRKSDYTPSTGGDALIVKTPEDKESPSAPADLTAVQAGVNTIRLQWTPSSDNSSIKEYLIIVNEDSVHSTTLDSIFTITGLQVNTDYSFAVKAIDLGSNISEASNKAYANTYLQGLYYEHSTGAWDNVAMIDWSTAEYSGFVSDFSLKGKTQEDFFNFSFDGFLAIAQEGVYQFRLTSDDGSVLSLNDTLLIANDGIHNTHTVTSPVTLLQAGPQRIHLKYFDYTLSDTLLVEYKGPDSNREWIKIPEEALTSSASVTSAENLPENTFDFDLYPNPTSNQNLFIHLQSNSTAPVFLDVKDTAGRILYSHAFEYANEIKLDLPGFFESGLYIVSMRQGTYFLTKRLVIDEVN